MKYSLIISLLFTIICFSQETNDNEILIEFQKPIEGFDVKINWGLKDSVSDFNNIIGPATVKLKRLTDGKLLKINIENFTVEDSITGLNIYERFKEKSVPNVLQLEIHPNIYFKDINFDQKNEFIVNYTVYDEEISKSYTNHRIFEFVNDELIEIDYFPTEGLDWSGKIDYEKQEVITREYFNCCSYEASFFKYDANSKEKFIFYKSESHNIDETSGNEEIIIEEKGKKKVTIFKKGK